MIYMTGILKAESGLNFSGILLTIKLSRDEGEFILKALVPSEVVLLLILLL